VAPIRVLIVDDSVVIRKILSDALGQDPDIEIAGVAANGRIALQKIPQTNPDLLTLDVEMPEMDGLQTLKALREKYPRLPVIMFSTLTERGATATLEALSLGATDYVTKPANVGSVTIAQDRIREELLPKIRALTGRFAMPERPVPSSSANGPAAVANKVSTVLKAAPPKKPTSGNRIDCVCIGVSTGGPNALLDLMPRFHAEFPVPIVIVQHMPPIFTKSLADRLKAKSRLDVQEAGPGQALKPGQALIAPGGFHLVVRRDGTRVVTAVNEDPPENSCRPAVDVLFRSVASVYGGNTLGVILTGMGQDGLRGCEVIKDCGGDVFVQDEKTSVVWGMPGFVANAGLADRIAPLASIGNEIESRVAVGRTAQAALRVEPATT